MNVFVYGPPGVGKSRVAGALAERLGIACVDTDRLVEASSGASVPDLIDRRGEAAFRRVEAEVCRAVAARDRQVVALGGGALLDGATRRQVESRGVVCCLDAPAAVLRARIARGGTRRPLVDPLDASVPPSGGGDAGGDAPAVRPAAAPASCGTATGDRLDSLLAARASHYASFVERVDTSTAPVSEVVERIADRLAPRVVSIRSALLSHETLIGYGLLDRLAGVCEDQGLGGAAALVADEGVAEALGARFPSGVEQIVVPRGETTKSLATVGWLLERFAALGLDRHSLIVAVGGGVVTDLAGFAAATFMRGVRWVAVPTSLVGMVDASVGGKTGVNLPAGKNLAGAFHPPSLVVTDPTALATLPAEERVSGMAEVVKHAIVGDEKLFGACETTSVFGSAGDLVRAITVKARVVEADPHERGVRAALNLGHTVGHALEAVSGFRLRHGEAVAIGLVAEARMAERIGLAPAGLAARLAFVLGRWGLPVVCAGADTEAVRRAMDRDKKRAGGRLRFALPAAVGRVDPLVEVPDDVIGEVLGGLGRA